MGIAGNLNQALGADINAGANAGGQSQLDVRRLLTGKDGQLFVTTSDGTQIFLAEVDTFQAQMNVNNTDYQPVGSSLVYGVSTGYSVTLTLTEAVVRDDALLETLFDDIKQGQFPSFDFQGKYTRRDGTESRQVFRNCIPDGSIDLMNLTPGEIIKRSWSFRVNATPELQAVLTY